MHEERVEGAGREDRRIGVHETARAAKPRRLQVAAAERSPEIVEVAAHDDGRARVKVREEMAVQEALDLEAPLETGQPEMEVEHRHRPLLVANPELGVERTPALLGPDGQIDVVGVDARPARQRRVPVVTLSAEAHVGRVAAVLHLERIADEVDLAVEPRAPRPLVHLLQHDQIGLVVAKDFENTLRSVTPVHAADSLVDVPGQGAEGHGARGRHGARVYVGSTRVLVENCSKQVQRFPASTIVV